MIALTSWFYAFWRCKNTKISENTQIFLVKILENTQIRRDGKQCKNTKIFPNKSVTLQAYIRFKKGNIWVQYM